MQQFNNLLLYLLFSKLSRLRKVYYLFHIFFQDYKLNIAIKYLLFYEICTDAHIAQKKNSVLWKIRAINKASSVTSVLTISIFFVRSFRPRRHY